MSRIIMLLIVLALLATPVYADNSEAADSVLNALVFGSLKIIPSFTVMAKDKAIDLSRNTDGKINGSLELSEVKENNDTKIDMSFSGLLPNTQYVSVYHHNDKCEFEVSTLSNVIHGAFDTDSTGANSISDTVVDEVGNIHSISLRTSKDFKVVACIKI